MHTIRLFCILTALLNFHVVCAQKSKKISSNSFVIEFDAGLSAADFDENQSVWKPTFYPALSLSLMGNKRLNARLDIDYGAGGTFYYLINQGPIDTYDLDFASPYLIAGLGYSFLQTQRQEQYVKLYTMAQLGYNDTFREEFDTYTVDVSSTSKYYYSLKVEYGLRRFTKSKSKKKNQKFADEFGVMFRYSLQNLGTATFSEDNFETTISPRGDVAGVYYKFLLSYGGKKVKRKVQQQNDTETIPPIIFNPRF